MPKLYLLTVLSHNYSWLCATLAANMPQELELGPVDPPTWITVRNSRFWYEPARMDKEFDDIKARLTLGRDVLLMGGCANPENHAALYKALKSRGITEIAEISPVFVVGRPAPLMNFYCVNHANRQSADLFASAASEIRMAPAAIAAAMAEWGGNNIATLADLSDFPDRQGGIELTRRLFAMWGYGKYEKPALMARSCTFFASATAIRLAAAMAVRDNHWPPLDDLAYLTALEQCDMAWRPEPVCPLPFRKSRKDMLESVERSLEKLCSLDSGSLSAPAWYWNDEGLVHSEPLDESRVQAFVNALPISVAEALARRLANDQDMLTPDQVQLQAALSARAGEFKHLGDTRVTPTLTVLTMTLNHEKYIADCMDSVLAQKTDFPVQHLVLDHYSTDGTPDIISEYASRYPSIRPVLLKGDAWMSNVLELYNRAHSEYVAMCDGDDYFIDENKLQLQVDFLRENPDCALVFHPVKVIFEDGTDPMIFPATSSLPRGLRKKYYLMDLVKSNFIQTNTVVYRWRFRDGLPDWFRHRICPGDWYMHLLHAELGKIGFLPRLMSVYRRHANALYLHSFRDSHLHRKMHGMKELEAYDEFNRYFQNRYFEPFALLAAGVLADFMELSLNNGEHVLFEEAMEKYPQFGLYFLKHVKPVKISRSQAGQERVEG